LSLLRLDAVACRRGGRLLFDGLNLSLAPGEAAVATGPNGVGKSSLLRLVARLLEPASGTIEAGAVALADERLALDERRTLAAALGFWAALDGRDAQAAMTAMGIDHLAEAPVRILSTGQRKRATLARVIASGAALWLLDEPANGLDVAGLELLTAAMAAHRSAGGAILAATHQPIGLADAKPVALG
jgi:heme exporter protein A